MLKAHCRCGHRIAVSDQFAGKRVKCPKCSGPVQIPQPQAQAQVAASQASAKALPRPRPAADRFAPVLDLAPEPAPRPLDAQLVLQMRQQSRDLARQSRNRTIAAMLGAIVLVATLVTVVILSNRKAESPSGPESAKAKQKTDSSQVASALPAPTTMDKASTQNESPPPDTAPAPGAGVGNEAGGTDIAQAKVEVIPLATTATYDVATDRTTLRSIPTLLNVGGKGLKLVISMRHNGKSLSDAFQMDAVLRVSGDFTGLVGLVIEGEPRLNIAIDGRDELELAPSGHDDAAGIKREDGTQVMPSWVEYTLGKTEIVALARGADIKTTLSGKPFKFTPEELALFGTFAPPAPKAPASGLRP